MYGENRWGSFDDQSKNISCLEFFLANVKEFGQWISTLWDVAYYTIFYLWCIPLSTQNPTELLWTRNVLHGKPVLPGNIQF